MSTVLDLRGAPEVRRLLGALSDQQLQNRVRRGLRKGGAIYRAQIRGAGQMGWPRRPATFHKTRTRPHRHPVGVSVNPQSPLSTIFEGGAKPHAIPITRGPFAGRTVMHPGVAAHPFTVPIFSRSTDEAEKAVEAEIFAGIR